MKATKNQIKIIDVLIDEFTNWKTCENIDEPLIYNTMIKRLEESINEYKEGYDMSDLESAIQTIFVKLRSLRNPED